MSDQFGVEEEHPLDWLKESSQFTENHLSRHSDLSKDHFLDDLLKGNPPPPPSSLSGNPHHRQRTKLNSKNYRDRKKGQLEHIRQEFDQLQRQNELLRDQKCCRWCRRPFAHPVLCPQLGGSAPQKGPAFLRKEELLDLQPEFEKPELRGKSSMERKGKIWIALGVLMLVLGVTIYGLEGDKKVVKQIEIYRDQMAKWSQQLESKEEEYLEVNLRIKEEREPMGKVGPGELRILYRDEPPRKGSSAYDEDKVAINKDFLYGIHAELDDIGVYL